MKTAHNADTALKLVKILQKLMQCMSQETLAVQNHNRDIAAKMSQEKTLLMHNYKSIQGELTSYPRLFDNLDDDIKKHLKDVIKEFEFVLKENMRAIDAGRGAVKRLIDRILKKARQAASLNPKAYNAQGHLVDNDMKHGIVPTKLNETY